MQFWLTKKLTFKYWNLKDTNGSTGVLPPLKSKLNGSATLHHNSSNHHHNGNMINGTNGTDNGGNSSDNMSIKLGSLVSNGSATNGSAVNNSMNTPTSNGHLNGHSLSGLPPAQHMNGVNTLPLMRPTTSDSCRTSVMETSRTTSGSIDSPKTESPEQQNGNFLFFNCFVGSYALLKAFFFFCTMLKKKIFYLF